MTEARDLANWPNAECSEFHSTRGVRWHIQRKGHGPVILFVHGTGASTHSFAPLANLLADEFETINLDLPGHGFSRVDKTAEWSLNGMARGIAELLTIVDVKPVLIVGHSAGAAILARMCLDKAIAPRALISLNGAFIPFSGVSATLFSSVAKLFVGIPIIPGLFSRKASDANAVDRLIRQTGSEVPRESFDCYRRLLASSEHVEAALRMMANWQLQPLYDQLPELPVALHLFSADGDRTIPAAQAQRIATWLPGTRVHPLTGVGHLAHEEQPALHAERLRAILEQESVTTGQ